MPNHSERAAYALQKLAEADPALGALALWCRHHDTDDATDTPAAWTAGQTIHYGHGFAALAAHEQVGLAAHHILHVAFRHGPRARSMRQRFGERFQADVYNIAADAVVNETLLRAGYALPRPCVALTPLLQDLGAEETVQDRTLGTLDCDALYVLLLHNRHARTFGTAEDTTDTDGRAARIRDTADRLGFAQDLDDDPHDLADDSAENDDAAWLQRLSVAMDQGRAAGRGIGALGFRLSDLPQTRTPWEVHLRGLVTKALMQARHTDYRKPARRWLAMDAAARTAGSDQPAFQPATRQDIGQPRIVVGLDSSGSIDRDRLGIFAAQVAAIARRTQSELHLLIFDEVVHSHTILHGTDMTQAIQAVQFSRDGGTSFSDVIARAMALDPSVIVMLTDLDGPFGDQIPGCPVLWAVPTQTQKTPPFGRVLSLSQ